MYHAESINAIMQQFRSSAYGGPLASVVSH